MYFLSHDYMDQLFWGKLIKYVKLLKKLLKG